MSRQPVIWHGCYNGSWNGIITPDSFAHPAKFAPGLIQRIYSHMLERGYLAAGDSVVDPFGGIAAGGYHAMLNGLHWTGVELEPRFVELGNRNIDKWRRDLAMLGDRVGTATLLQGDSRRLLEVVGGGMGAAVSSPPYIDAINNSGEGPGARHDYIHHKPDTAERQSSANGYGQTPGNLGNLAGVGFDAAVGSPPFAGTSGGKGEASQNAIDSALFARHLGSMVGTFDTQGNLGNLRADDANLQAAVRYLATPNNRSIIGVWQPVLTVEQQSPEEANDVNPVVTSTLAKSYSDDQSRPATGSTSPPQSSTNQHLIVGENHTPTGKAVTTNGAATHGESSAAPLSKGTAINAPDVAQPAAYKSTTSKTERIAAGNGTTVSTTSKHYASHVTAKSRRSISLKRELARSAASCSTPQSQGARYVPINAGRHPLNSLNSDTTKAAKENLTPSPDNFWAAARVIVEQTYSVLKPGGYAAWVTKRFVRKGQIVEFSDQWEQLCAAVGFEPVERIAAMLVEDHGDQLDIFGGATARLKERKSFFRRLAEKKGSPRIDWEDVVIMRKPDRAHANGNGARSEL